MSKFSKKFNYDESIIRSVTAGVMGEFYRKVRWINRWEDNEKLITVPVYYGMIGDERFVMDAFVDDIVGKRPDLNIDPIPRAHFNYTNAIVKRNEYSNPNANVIYYKEENGVLKKLMGKMRQIPIKISYHIEIKLAKEIDMMRCHESIWDFFFAYKYFYVVHNSIRLDCVLDVPDDKEMSINREIAGIGDTNDTVKYIKFDFDVHTYHMIEPIETPPLVATNCNRVIFKGYTRTLGVVPENRKFVGGGVNKGDCGK